MKRVLSLIAIISAFTFNANAQRTANLAAYMVLPDTGSVTTLDCVDSYVVNTGFINQGPDVIYPTDTIVFNDAFSQSGYVWYTSGDTVKVGDTVVGETGYYHVSDLQSLYDGTTGTQVFAPFADGNYFFGSTFIGFGLSAVSTAVVYDDSTLFQVVAPVTISCNTTAIHNVKLNQTALTIFPNPTTDKISFTNNFTAATDATVQITDIAGRVIKSVDLGKQAPGTKTFSVDVQSLTNGMYYIQLVTNTTKSVNKFIKN